MPVDKAKITIEAIEAELRNLDVRIAKVKNNGNLGSTEYLERMQAALQKMRDEILAGEKH